AVARLLELRHVPRLRPPRRGLPQRRRAGRGSGGGAVNRPARKKSPSRTAVRVERPAAPPEPTMAARALAGAREPGTALRARIDDLLRPEPPGTTMIRPSEVGVDRLLVGAVLVLVAFGMVMVFSSGAVFAAKKYGDSAYFLKREIIYALL